MWKKVFLFVFVSHVSLNACRNAFGPSFGTVCLSGLLIAVVRMVRTIVDGARKEGTSGIVNLILRCCVNALLSAIDFLNKFTIVFAAITGESYCSSARMTYELLKRNLLSAVFVETISTRLLAGIIFVLSALYAVVVSYLSKSRSFSFPSITVWGGCVYMCEEHIHTLKLWGSCRLTVLDRCRNSW